MRAATPIWGLHSAVLHAMLMRATPRRDFPWRTHLASVMSNPFTRMLLALAALLGACASACAHPHVWVTMQGELVYAPEGSVTGVRYAWTFDDMFSAFAIPGLEAK